MPRFRDIPQFTKASAYHVDVAWDYMFREWLPEMLNHGLDLNPDFQRGHVWTEEQQIRYCEFILRGGHSSKEIYINDPHWNKTFKDGYAVLVDGKQRIEAARRFIQNEIKVFGHFKDDFTDRLDFLKARFSVNINDLATKAEVYQWYLDLNDGGVAHTKAELDKVRKLMAAAEKA